MFLCVNVVLVEGLYWHMPMTLSTICVWMVMVPGMTGALILQAHDIFLPSSGFIILYALTANLHSDFIVREECISTICQGITLLGIGSARNDKGLLGN